MAFRKKRKTKPTYDSDETKVVIGLIAFCLAIFIILSYFLTGPFFVFLKSLAGAGTVFLSGFFLFLALALFRTNFPFATKRSILGMILLTISFTGIMASFFSDSLTSTDDRSLKYGGLLGYYIYTFLNERVFLNFTPVFLVFLMAFSLPLVASVSFVVFFEKIGQASTWMILKFKGNKDIKEIEQNSKEINTFGDFRRQHTGVLGQDKPNKPLQVKEKTSEGHQTVSNLSGEKSATKVAIVEKSKEGAFVNEELQYPGWKLPPAEVLDPFKKKKPSQANINKNADIIEQTLKSFGVKATVVDVLIGPTVTQYALDIALGTKVNKISNLSNDLALALATSSSALRIEAPIPGTSYVGVEIPNEDRETVYSKEILSDNQLLGDKYRLPLGLGVNLKGETIYADLQKMPHMLVAGATGSGKSVLTNGFLISLLMSKTPDEVKFIMIDPKQVELSDYNGIPHLLTPVITEMDKVINALKWAIAEMERRYTVFKDAKVRNIEAYNKMMGFSAIPYIVLVVDEMADMMMSTNRVETEAAIVRLAQKARATGLHLILATQRPSVDVITGLIKANIPCRIGMSVTTQIDSRVILDHIGAESLLGMGDMLYKDPTFSRASRIQGFWISSEEIQKVVQYIKDQVSEVEYTKEVVEAQKDPNAPVNEAGDLSDDDQFANAVRVIVNSQKGSASLLQRKLKLGYNRAARLLDELEEYGVVSAPNGSKPRDVLITDAEEFLQSMGNPENVASEE